MFLLVALQVLTGAQKIKSKLIEVSNFIPCLRNSASLGVHNASLQEMYSVRYCSSICVCGWVFTAFVIRFCGYAQ